MTKTVKTFTDDLIESSGCDPKDVKVVEAIMRDNNHVLGELTRAQFNREARKAKQQLDDMREIRKVLEDYEKHA